jgi:hypothetical protein
LPLWAGMRPKLPCLRPSISICRLARHTGRRTSQPTTDELTESRWKQGLMRNLSGIESKTEPVGEIVGLEDESRSRNLARRPRTAL